MAWTPTYLPLSSLVLAEDTRRAGPTLSLPSVPGFVYGCITVCSLRAASCVLSLILSSIKWESCVRPGRADLCFLDGGSMGKKLQWLGGGVVYIHVSPAAFVVVLANISEVPHGHRLSAPYYRPLWTRGLGLAHFSAPCSGTCL